MTARILAEITDYAGLVCALRDRVMEQRLSMSSPALHEVAGLPDRYIAKVLGPDEGVPAHLKRRLGLISLGPVLAVLGVKLRLVEDGEALARYAGRLDYMNENDVRGRETTMHNRLVHTIGRQYFQKLGRKGGKKGGPNSRKKMTRTRARRLAKAAAKARWG